jgi:hypothetical protein
MKNKIVAFVFVATTLNASAFAETFPLTGTFQPSSSQGCADLQFDSTKTVEISSNRDGVIVKSGNASEAAYPVASVDPADLKPAPGSPFFNEFPEVTIGVYQNNNSTFKFAEGAIDVLANPNPNVDSVLSGQYDIELSGAVLTIDSTVNPSGGTSQALPKTTCLLQKL